MKNRNGTLGEQNHKVYERENVVKGYLKSQSLYPPELILFTQLSPHLHEMSLIDIGIGGGRTTGHFATRVKKYVGIDYSQGMVSTCQNRFSQGPKSMELHLGDVRDLSAFANQSFDIVLFSYNGLDYINHEGRLQGLSEMNRILRPGGSLIFSSHNLEGFGQSRQLPHETWLRSLAIRILLRLANGSPTRLRKKPHALIRDDGLGFKLKTYYVKPSEQLNQLADLGLSKVELYGMDGRLISKAQPPNTVLDEWIYYRAIKR